MYRSHCKANGAGKYVKVNVSDTGSSYTKSVSLTSSKGAKVSGRVTRTGGRTNKEILVRLSSTDGVRVLRTAMTDGAGRFTVSGLPSGNWSVAVNSDSWRGIGRAFKGRHSIRVTAGKSYSVGTLQFRG
ncbi:carboxypeptidase-like regulatory domain-containing protein [Aeromicrobium sp. UC242_57]|uniref:carboxypeptidase-like regulatory domain-containing protein n=1 Tax=Aeromicrobium sp. UC242_57 TaxID=3374624 RepID=UPI00379DCD04